MAMPALADLNAQAAGLVARLKPSERRLLSLLALAALIGVVVLALDVAQKASARNTTAQAGLDRARQVLRRNQGSAAGQVAEVRSQVRAWSWQADTTEVGKVLIQSEVADIAKKAGLSEVEVKVADKVQDEGEVKLVTLDVTAPFTWPGLAAFLEGLEGAGKGYVLDTVQLPDDDKPRLRVIIRAPLMVIQTAAPIVAKPPPKLTVRP